MYPKSTKRKKQKPKVTMIHLQDKKECYITHRTDGLHKHHIFGGPLRKWSELYGLYVWLRPEWHNMSDYGVHFNPELDSELKQLAQEKFEQVYNRSEFVQVFGKNYL